MNLKGKKIVVLGFGKSGRETAFFLAGKGARVVVNDKKSPEAFSESLEAFKLLENVTFVLGSQKADLIDKKVDLVIKSPGIHPRVPPIVEALRLGVPVLTEVEVAYHFNRAFIIGITGTNGKTTTTSLVSEILKKTTKKVYTAGNIGVPLLSVVESTEKNDILVAELSSFQLDNIKCFRPQISAILNITPDHLDYHQSFQAYVGAKAKILLNQRKDDFTVLNADDPLVASFKDRGEAQAIMFSREQFLDRGVFIKKGQIVSNDGSKETMIMPSVEVALPGAHNLENVLAAVAITSCVGVCKEKIAETLRTFKSVEHRLEEVRELSGVKFINDSKATNTGAALKALESYEKPLILIAGGMDRGSTFDELAVLINKKVSYLILLGEAKEKIAHACRERGFGNYIMVDSLQEAVAKASQEAKFGDTVLLSPACPSWDMFASFEERGNLFKSLVIALGGG